MLCQSWIATISVTYLTSIPGRSAPAVRRCSKSSASSLVVSRAGEKGNFSIAAAVPTVIPSITMQTMINTGWISESLVIKNQGNSGFYIGFTITPQSSLHWSSIRSSSCCWSLPSVTPFLSSTPTSVQTCVTDGYAIAGLAATSIKQPRTELGLHESKSFI